MREVRRFKEAHAPEVASYASVENSKLVICLTLFEDDKDLKVSSTSRPIQVQQCQNNQPMRHNEQPIEPPSVEKNQERDKFTKSHQDKKSMLLYVSEEEISKSSGCLAAIYLYIRENRDVVAVARDALTPLLALASSSVLTNSF
ncbi:hypothetical protein Tco_1249323 [Tanacetum coccineum]